jgi:nucleoside phosphorylase
MADYRADVVIIVALRDELDAVLAHLPNAQRITFPQSDNRTYWVATLPADTPRPYRVVVTLLPVMGNIESALAANDALHLWQPTAIFVVGIAGGLRSDEQNFGDIVIASQILYYEEQKLTKSGPETRPRLFEPARMLLDRALNYRADPWGSIIQPPDTKFPKKKPRVFVAPIASGEKVFASAKATDMLRKIVPKVAAVEMETAGVTAAVLAGVKRTDVLVIRGISDFADTKKDDHARDFAAATAAAWTIGFLGTGPISTNGLAPIPTGEPTPPPLLDREQLFDEMLGRLDSEDFKTLCFILGVDVDDLPGEKKSARVRELIKYFERRGELAKLAELWRRARAKYFS